MWLQRLNTILIPFTTLETKKNRGEMGRIEQIWHRIEEKGYRGAADYYDAMEFLLSEIDRLEAGGQKQLEKPSFQKCLEKAERLNPSKLDKDK